MLFETRTAGSDQLHLYRGRRNVMRRHPARRKKDEYIPIDQRKWVHISCVDKVLSSCFLIIFCVIFQSFEIKTEKFLGKI